MIRSKLTSVYVLINRPLYFVMYIYLFLLFTILVLNVLLFVVDPCEDVFCFNGGTCILTPESYINASKPCICQKQFAGRLCDTYLAGKDEVTTFHFQVQHTREYFKALEFLVFLFPSFLRAFMSKSDRRAAYLVTEYNVVPNCSSS